MLHKITCLFSTLLLIPLLTAHGAADIAVTRVPFPVRTHGAIQLTKAELQEVLNKAQAKLALRGVHILLDPVDSFGPDGNVINEADIVFEAGDDHGCKTIKKFLEDHPGVVHIVSEIPCCGTPIGGLVGCSGLDKAMLVLDPQPDVLESRAVQWMHELGHNKGLCHSRCSANALMSPNPIGEADTDLDSCEQHVFNGGLLSDPVCTQAQPQSCRQMDCNDNTQNNTQATLQRRVK